MGMSFAYNAYDESATLFIYMFTVFLLFQGFVVYYSWVPFKYLYMIY